MFLRGIEIEHWLNKWIKSELMVMLIPKSNITGL